MARKWPDWDSNAGPADSRVGAPNASIITDEGVIKYFEKYKIPYIHARGGSPYLALLIVFK